jgi:hypothetical protein
MIGECSVCADSIEAQPAPPPHEGLVQLFDHLNRKVARDGKPGPVCIGSKMRVAQVPE